MEMSNIQGRGGLMMGFYIGMGNGIVEWYEDGDEEKDGKYVGEIE